MELVKIKATNTTLTPAITDYVNAKLGKNVLEKFAGSYGEISSVEVEVGKTTNHHTHGDVFRAEVNLLVRGDVVRADSEQGDLYAAIDDVRDEIINALKSKKTKSETLWRRGARNIKKLIRWE